MSHPAICPEISPERCIERLGQSSSKRNNCPIYAFFWLQIPTKKSHPMMSDTSRKGFWKPLQKGVLPHTLGNAPPHMYITPPARHNKRHNCHLIERVNYISLLVTDD